MIYIYSPCWYYIMNKGFVEYKNYDLFILA
nr:MAG TPA_asm: hypothetical protein [Caudoviricetes sp.]